MKKRHLLYRGVDYIKAFIDEEKNQNKNFTKLKKLSSNSNQEYISYGDIKLSIVKIPGGKYKELYSISLDSISIGFIGLYGGQSPDMIEITGQGLTIFGDRIFYFLFDFFGLTFIKFKRVDLCFDMELNINYFFDSILIEEKKEKINKIWKTKKNGIETIEFSKKNIKENSYQFIRIYNKILDSKNKNKLFLYEDKYKKDDGTYMEVTRFEVEIRESICSFYEFNFIKNYKGQFFKIVETFYKMNTQFFHFLSDEDFIKMKKKLNAKNKELSKKIKKGFIIQPTNIYQKKLLNTIQKKKNDDLYGTDWIDETDKIRTITMFKSYGLRLVHNGMDKNQLLSILGI